MASALRRELPLAARTWPGQGPADQAGILESDIVISLAEQPTTSIDDMHKLLMQLPVGVPSPVVMLRGERQLERWVVPNDYPEPVRQE